MSRLECLAIAALWVLASGAARPVFAQPPQERSDQTSSEQEVWAALEKFDGEEAFQRYLRAAHNQSSARFFSTRRGGSSAESYALTPTPAPEFPPALPASGPTLEAIRSATAAASVDEGDIVQQIGRFLIVLKDGRLFSIDTRPDGHPGLRLVDRANVYRTNGRASYTTMLASANRLVVKGVNHEVGENEIAVFALNESGALMYGGAVYFRGAGDRAWLADDKLVVYSDAPLLEWGVGPLGWPWRVSRSPRNRGQSGPGTVLLDARNVYAPLQHTNYPVLRRSKSDRRIQGPFEYDGSLLDWENWQHRNRRFVASAEGSLLGIPTIAGAGENEDPDLRRAPGVVFVSLGATGQISPLGALRSNVKPRVHWRYRCRVACTDWSRYARAIFLDDRVFAWAGADLIEGEIANGAIREIRRINLTAPLRASR